MIAYIEGNQEMFCIVSKRNIDSEQKATKWNKIQDLLNRERG